ncbi:hypothetical protein GW17_00038923, partial [Ensete ventricosum]
AGDGGWRHHPAVHAHHHVALLNERKGRRVGEGDEAGAVRCDKRGGRGGGVEEGSGFYDLLSNPVTSRESGKASHVIRRRSRRPQMKISLTFAPLTVSHYLGPIARPCYCASRESWSFAHYLLHRS